MSKRKKRAKKLVLDHMRVREGNVWKLMTKHEHDQTMRRTE